jgi:hypothetical protein
MSDYRKGNRMNYQLLYVMYQVLLERLKSQNYASTSKIVARKLQALANFYRSKTPNSLIV